MFLRKIEIKEVGNPHVVVTYDHSTKTDSQVVEWFGLNEPDVEWYKITLISTKAEPRFNIVKLEGSERTLLYGFLFEEIADCLLHVLSKRNTNPNVSYLKEPY